MKNYYKYIIPCLAITLLFSSCYDTMDDKASIDALYETLTNPVVNATTATAETYQTATATGSVATLENVQEVGFQISTDSSFGKYETVTCEEVSQEFTAEFSGLEEKTTYYVRSYAFTKTGITVYGETTTFTTPKSPIFDIEGTYTATTYQLNWDDYNFYPGYTNKVTIAYVEGSTTEIKITNLYDEGETVVASYDAETGKIVIPSGQLVMTHPDYGDITITGFDENLDFTDEIELQFTPLGGKIDSFMWGLKVMEIYFWDACITSMSHDE